MNLNLNFHHGLNTSQQMSLAPQLLQWLRLLHVSTLDLSTMVRKELETNPALEFDGQHENEAEQPADAVEEPALSDTAAGEDRPDEKHELLADAAEEWNDEALASDSSTKFVSSDVAAEKYEYAFNSIEDRDTLQEHLLKQLGLSGLPETELELAELIIGSLDERGYLEAGLEDLVAPAGTSLDKLEKALAAVQALDPPGVGARDLRECLMLQMPDDEEHKLPRTIVARYLDAMARKQYSEVASLLNVQEKEILEAMELIKSLNPNPGDRFPHLDTTHYISADITIRKGESGYLIEMNDSYIPRIRISASCRRMLNKGSLSAQEAAYVRDKIRAANFIIQGIRQRRETMRKVADAIVEAQREFLDTENGKPVPLTMAQLAQSIGVHETTVSRAIANKYIQTPRGLFPMKHFFCSGYSCADGSAITPESVKELIAEAVEREDPKAPLTDIQISAMLKKKGLRVARRTIAKYREEMSIPSSKERVGFAEAAR